MRHNFAAFYPETTKFLKNGSYILQFQHGCLKKFAHTCNRGQWQPFLELVYRSWDWRGNVVNAAYKRQYRYQQEGIEIETTATLLSTEKAHLAFHCLTSWSQKTKIISGHEILFILFTKCVIQHLVVKFYAFFKGNWPLVSFLGSCLKLLNCISNAPCFIDIGCWYLRFEH